MRVFLPFLFLVACLFCWIPEKLFAADQTLETLVPLETPRKKPPRQGGPLDKVEIKIWIPDGVQVIRGAVVNPFYTKTVTQKHWQEACRLWDFALVGANYFGVKNQEFAPRLMDALKTFASECKHPELPHIPFCFVGMSAGGGMSMRLADQIPERTIAAAPVCLEVGPRSEMTRKIPVVTIFGERDGRQMEKLAERLPEQRKQGALWATAVQWRKRHDFYKANNLAMPFFDQVIRHRYPKTANPTKSPVKLLPYKIESGWLGDRSTWDTDSPTVAAYAKFSGDKAQACWLPNSYVAQVWRAFVSQNPKVKIKFPPGLGGGQPFVLHQANKPIEVKLSLQGKAKKLVLFDGDNPLKTTDGTAEPTSIQLPAGIHALIAVATLEDGSESVSRPTTIIVRE